MNCPNCGNPTHGGYCDCMIKDGEFVGIQIPMSFTKQQWEDIYQWYLVVKEEYRMEQHEIEAGEQIANNLKKIFGNFN